MQVGRVKSNDPPALNHYGVDSVATNVAAGPATISIGGAATTVTGDANPDHVAVTLTVRPVGNALPAATNA